MATLRNREDNAFAEIATKYPRQRAPICEMAGERHGPAARTNRRRSNLLSYNCKRNIQRELDVYEWHFAVEEFRETSR